MFISYWYFEYSINVYVNTKSVYSNGTVLRKWSSKKEKEKYAMKVYGNETCSSFSSYFASRRLQPPHPLRRSAAAFQC